MNGYLSSVDSMCGERQKLIVSTEGGLKHIADNVNINCVRQFKIDGDVIKDNNVKKCDFLVLNDDKRVAYFIELKNPSRINESVGQIHETIKILHQELLGYKYHGRVISKDTHGVPSNKMLAYRKEHLKKYNGDLIFKSRQYEEKI